MEKEVNQLVTATKTLISEEVKNSEVSLLSEIYFMIKQLQVELQHGMRAIHKAGGQRQQMHRDQRD